ncbi:hypothetical protein ACJRO7_031027 [Eucalyptus globulus]|uniref:Endonuclease/exonuclease/phosphatase domain-containing protein n=1 Tax=Eucalyptus globulus TaxID=34317 RepID=A0ABD3JP52_EUCGL
MQGSAWLIVGDFNAINNPSDCASSGSSTTWVHCFDEFSHCLDRTELEDLRYVGLRYTWSTFSNNSRKMRKIDRVLVNTKWNDEFSFSEASFLNPEISNHSPMVVRILSPASRRKPFKFYDFWMKHPDFSSIVQQVWEIQVDGMPMFRLVCKLKALKGRLKRLNREAFSNISVGTNEARNALRTTQLILQEDPDNVMLAELEKTQHRVYVELRTYEESFLRQKSRVRWLKEGDLNTKFFHQLVNRRQLRN